MILVTGATGFIGRSLMRALQTEERPVKAFTGRINDPLSLQAELLDVDTIIHLAGAEIWGKNRLLKQVDVDGTAGLLEEGQRAKVRRFVLVSRLNANPNSHYTLLRTKGEEERLVKHSEIPYTIVRSATLFGPGDRFLNTVAGLAAWTWPAIWLPGGGRVAMQPLWVEDLVRCVSACLDRDDLIGSTIEIAGEERMNYTEIAREVLHTAGMRRMHFGVSPKLIRPISTVLFGWQRRPPVTRYFMDRFSVPEVAPIDSVSHHFGFHPSRMGQRIAYLRRSGLRWRMLRQS